VNIVDAHQHFWDPARSQYPRMGADHAAIRRRFAALDAASDETRRRVLGQNANDVYGLDVDLARSGRQRQCST
jgi:predicted TIM-barrel fold metal-dependent hydrolase